MSNSPSGVRLVSRAWLHGLATLAMVCGAGTLRAEVVRLEITARQPFAESHSFGAAGPYETIAGKLYYEVDPLDPANERVTDLKLAPRNARGRVEFWADFFLLTPVDAARGNRRVLYDVNNRGNKLALGAFNNQGGNTPATLADAGNGFLFRQGYSILWCGWNGDVRPGDGRMQIGLPVAQENGQPIRGEIYAEICVDRPSYSQPLAWGNTAPYTPISLDNGTATLRMRPDRGQEAVEVPRDQWSFARWEGEKAINDPEQLYIQAGFQPGWLYELTYHSQGPRVTGLGFVAVRDAVSFFRYAHAATGELDNPLADVLERAYAFGISQSARFIHHFLYEDFNADEQGRLIFDGALAHVGGAGKGQFNSRFAQTTRHGSQHEDHFYPTDFFPFNTVPGEDPLTGQTGDLFDRPRRRHHLPKIFFTETSTEYWARAASLLHTDVQGQRDVPLDPQARLYFFTGAQHGVAGSSDRGIYQNLVNVLDHRPLLRSLLVALDQWVTSNQEPPPSNYPRISGGTLVSLEAYQRTFPKIPGMKVPAGCYAPLRLDPGPRFRDEGIAEHVPPIASVPYRTLVPAVGDDGNELAGIRLPDIAVPRATFTGWNPRGAAAGAEGKLGRWSGSYFPFAKTLADRQAAGDPRAAVRERYPTRESYVARVAETALQLQHDRLLLDEDLVRILRAARDCQDWD